MVSTGVASKSMATSLVNQLPIGLFEDKSAFLEAMTLWQTAVSPATKETILQKYLPSHMTAEEKNETLKMLLDNRLTRFDVNPLDRIYTQLRLQRLAPDIAKTLSDIKQLHQKAQEIKEEEFQIKILKDVKSKRRRFLTRASKIGIADVLNGHRVKLAKVSQPKRQVLLTKKDDEKSLLRHNKVFDRYKSELVALRTTSLCDSSDENDVCNQGTAESSPFSCYGIYGKSSSALSGVQLPEDKYKRLIRNHKRRKKDQTTHCVDVDPTMDTMDVTLNDIISRVTSAPEEEFLRRPSPIRVAPKQSQSNGKLSTSSVVNKKNKTVSVTIKKPEPPIVPPTRQGLVKPENLEGDTFTRVSAALSNETGIKKESLDVFDFEDSPPEAAHQGKTPQAFNSTVITSSTTSSTTSVTRPVPLLLPAITSNHTTPLVSTSTMAIPEAIPPIAQLETPPASFFSLLRDIFREYAPGDHKLTLHRLEELVKEKVRLFDSKIGWNHEIVQSAMNYLSGVLPPPEMIPLVDYKEKNQQWQWIGGDRDSDSVLQGLSLEWDNEKGRSHSLSAMDPSQPIPPAMCQTEWAVRPTNDTEKTSYREQEAIRYTNPHKGFTYRVHAYESVVGPVKGCGTGMTSAHAASPNKAREHSLLVSDRPPFVTLLSLVRDAAARLPNGEGTRADICELLKDSQYLLPSVSDQQVNGIVSGALDRLHYEKDPCVRYDVNRKVWIYLHRNRSVNEFERLHEMQVAAAKAKRSLSKTTRRGSTSRSSSSISLSAKQSLFQKISKSAPTSASSSMASNGPSSSPVPSLTPPASIQPLPSSSASPSPTCPIAMQTEEKHAPANYSTLQAVTEILQSKRLVQAQSPSPQIAKKKAPKAIKIIENSASVIAMSTVSSVCTTSTNTATPNPSLNHCDTNVISAITTNYNNVLPRARPCTVRAAPPKVSTLKVLPQNSGQVQSSSNDQIQHVLSMANSTSLHHGNANSHAVTQIVKAENVKLNQPQTLQVTPKQIHLTMGQPQQHAQAIVTSSNIAGSHQISIPSSLFFSGRPTSVMLGKSHDNCGLLVASLHFSV